MTAPPVEPPEGARATRDPLPADLLARDAACETAARSCHKLWETSTPIKVKGADAVLFNICFSMVADTMNNVATGLELQHRFRLGRRRQRPHRA